MDQPGSLISIISLGMGAAWASGLNLYATILVLGVLAGNGYIDLPPDLMVLTDPLILFAAGAMYLVEFFTDKVPGVDSGWDLLHTFIRIPAAAALAAGAVGEVSTVVSLAAALVGGTVAAGTHATKAGSRALVNTSPEPFSNWFVSLSEDVLVVAGLWTALQHPILFLCLLVLFGLLVLWLLPKIWRALRSLFSSLWRFISPARNEPELVVAIPMEQGSDAPGAEQNKLLE